MTSLTIVSLAFVSTFVALLVLIKFAPDLHLLDHPGGRKEHAGVTPTVGGLAIALAFLAALPLLGPASVDAFALAVLIILIVGVIDDVRELSPLPKFLMQAVAVLIMFYFAGVGLRTVGNLIGLGSIGMWKLAPLMTVFAVIGVINAMNMADGIDGHAGFIALIAFLAFAYVARESYLWDQYKLLLVLAGGVAAFLTVNARSPWLRRARTFLGDAGSMFLGLMIAWFAVDLSQGQGRTFPAICALWIVVIPLCDCVSLMIRRKRAGRSMFVADRQHLHHYLLNRRLSVGQATMVSAAANVLCAAVGVIGWKLRVPEPIMFAGFVAFFIGYHIYMTRALRITPENSKLASESMAT